MEISLDFGGSFVDVVIFKEKEIVKTVSFSNSAETNIYKKLENIFSNQYEKIYYVGSPKYFSFLKKHAPVTRIEEIKAIGAGALFLYPTKKPVLIASLGTGTCFVSFKGNCFQHVGGTAIGGGTLLGLSNLLFQETNINKIEDLALKGSSKNIHLSIQEIVGTNLAKLDANLAASYFAKAINKKNNYKLEDLAQGVFSLCGGVIASTLKLAAESERIKTVLLGGRLAQSSLMVEIIKNFTDIFKIKVEVLNSCEYMTAIGAFSYGEKRN